ncbi:hypothetical protein GWL_41920 [Herbaspirillum sp. GW103]|nr:hypothetical protein GWL_41920 [Herbaspirillum sp. GW103]
MGFNQLHSQFVLASSGLKGAVGRRSVMPMSRVFLLWVKNSCSLHCNLPEIRNAPARA